MASHYRNPSLLLLPPPPDPADHEALDAAYKSPIRAAIARLRDHRDDRGSVLCIAVAAPFLALTAPSSHPTAHHEALLWPDAQSVLARVYSIVAIVCAQLDVPSEMHSGPGSVDVRVLLVHHELSSTLPQQGNPALHANNTVIVDLPTFVASCHPWSLVFHVDSELGRQLFSSYSQICGPGRAPSQDQSVVVEAGVPSVEGSLSSPPTKTYPVVCLGGTFDHLHAGHKLLLTAAAILLRIPETPVASPARFIIGVTGDELLKQKKYAELVQSWDLRVANIIEFLAAILQHSESGAAGPDITKEDDKVTASYRDGAIEIRCVVLRDKFGPTVTEEEMDVLVVSGETRSGGDAVNAERKKHGWHHLEIFEVDVLDAEDTTSGPTPTKTDFATKISSTAIRERKAEALK
ncbi:cytidylyltransferase [Astrocystis sublimbata]|nr:cytidylyltransferase [Astrocystis sublimbata]